MKEILEFKATTDKKGLPILWEQAFIGYGKQMSVVITDENGQAKLLNESRNDPYRRNAYLKNGSFRIKEGDHIVLTLNEPEFSKTTVFEIKAINNTNENVIAESVLNCENGEWDDENKIPKFSKAIWEATDKLKNYFKATSVCFKKGIYD